MSLTGELTPPYTLEQLVHVFRQEADDLPGDIVDTDTPWDNDDSGLLWKNSEIVRYANAAQREFFVRVKQLDNSTTEVTQIAVTADTSVYEYDDRVQTIRRVKFIDSAGDEHVLTKVMQEDADSTFPNWETAESGVPNYYIEDMDERKITLYFTPELSGTLYLTVYRLPLAPLSWAKRHLQLEVPTDHQDSLLDYMLHRAYLKKDAETERPQLSAEHLQLFTANVGDRPSAHLQTVRRRESRAHRRIRATFF